MSALVSPQPEQLRLCLVGIGPRGLSVLERLCANAQAERAGTVVTVHVIDPHPAGAGGVWRTGQRSELLMNTVSSQVTMFTDESVDKDGPTVQGPSLHAWAQALATSGSLDGYPQEVLDEAVRLGPDSYPTRAFYGNYLRWVFQRVVRLAPDEVRVQVHRSHAVALDDLGLAADSLQRVVLADGTVLDGLHAVVLAQGHRPVAPTAAEQALLDHAAAHDLTYVLPSNPGDADLSVLRPGEPVGLRGLGLNFFDYMALLTVGRGGTFERVDGTLQYRPSGQEPVLYAGSRRGVPFHSRGENEKGVDGCHVPVVLTPDVVAGLRARGEAKGGVDFRRELWPLIAKEVETVYYATLLSRRLPAAAVEAFRTDYLAASYGDPAEARLLDEAGVPAEARFDWEALAQPTGGRRFADAEEFRAWLVGYLRADLAAAREGNVSGPLKAALDVLRDLRNDIRKVVDHGGLSARSHREDLEQWYTPFNGFLSIGPPAQRIEQAIALVRAGVLHVLGPDVSMRPDPTGGGFLLSSPVVGGEPVRVRALVEARLPESDVRRTTDPLLRQLLATGQARPHSICDPQGASYETGGLSVTGRPYHLVDATGRAHPRRFAFGVPTEAVHWATAAGIRPGVNSVILGDADAIARAVLRLVDTTVLPGLVPAQRQPSGRSAALTRCWS